MHTNKDGKALIPLVILFILPLLFFAWWSGSDFLANPNLQSEKQEESMTTEEQSGSRLFPELRTDTSKATIPLNQILSGGPGKDGIPSIDDPKFESVSQANLNDDVRGILIEMNGEKRYYPYNVLVWHEIVNDQIGETPFMVTFCPLCGTAIAFDRRVEGTTHEFGVSGLLFESNLLMYDRTTETLWSQARGEAVVGELTGQELTFLPFQLLPFKDIKERHADAKVLSSDTGHIRNYTSNPYGNYDENEELFFPVSVRDSRFSAKELMYVVPLSGKSVAFPSRELQDGKTNLEKDGVSIEVEKTDGEIFISDGDGNSLPGYYEMWFSWATHHQEDGIVFEL